MKVVFKSIEKALSQPLGRYFWVSREGGRIKYGGNEDSFYRKNILDENLTFDISNNKVLANISIDGSIKSISVYRGTYEVDSMYRRSYEHEVESIAGVWYFKDITQTGPYYLSLRIGEKRWELNKVNWPLKSGLLDNIFPITELRGAGLEIKSVTYAPISQDGKFRPRVLIYGILLKNVSSKVIRVTASLKTSLPIRSTYIKLLDGLDYDGKIEFDLKPNDNKWLPFVISAIPRKKQFQKEVEEKTSLEWLNSTWSYFRKVTGRLEMPQDHFVQEFFERAIHQCIESVCMMENGEVTGSNQGTSPIVKDSEGLWMRDVGYCFLPLYMFEPELFKKGILWFLDRSVCYEGNRSKGGITHSLSNALIPVVMCGLYYTTTADKDFFQKNSHLKSKIEEIMGQVINSRKGNVWLFPSKWVSDGPSLGDYHTGSNLVAWYCFKSWARIMKEVYNERFTEDQYLKIAEKIKKDMEKHNVIDGPFGPQYIEGTNADGSIPCMVHDGEESDTTLMPVYGYTEYDNPKYKNYTRFALTEHNLLYSAESRGIKWPDDADATFPGYVTGFASVTDEKEMNGKQGYMTLIRQLTDVDGSIWWWPYPENNSKYGNVQRQCVKCGWASGVFVTLFTSEFLGIKYDAPEKKLRFRPFSPSSNFKWKCLRMGKACFDVSYERKEEKKKVLLSIKNSNQFGILAEYTIILEKNTQVQKIKMNGAEYKDDFKYGKFLGKSTIAINASINAQQRKTCEVEYL